MDKMLNPKFEYLNPKQILIFQFSKFQTGQFGTLGFSIWDLFRISDFGFRIFRFGIWCLFIGIFFIGGCGYTAKSILPNDIKAIYVKTFVNRIDITREVSEKDRYSVYRPNLEIDLTNVIIDRFFLDGNLRIVREDYADARLEGELIEYRRDPVRYAGKDVEEYRISLVTNLRLIDLRKNETIWEEKNIVGDATYFTTGALQKSETTALNDALSDLARRIVERTVEGW